MDTPISETPLATPEARAARRWLGLSVASLVLAGVLSLLLVLGRMPPFDRLVTDPLLFRRFLVVHVDLSLVVWFYAFIAGLLFALPAPGASSLVARASAHVGAAGVALMVLGAGTRGAEPVLANYVPMIDGAAFEVGLVVFGVAVVASFLDARLLPARRAGHLFAMPDAAEPGLRATAIAILVAALTFATSWAGAPRGLAPETLFELANWGGGHVLQLASTAALLTVWLVLLAGVLGRSPVSRRAASTLFALLVLPWLVAPLLAARGIQDVAAREGFTRLMQFGLFPVVVAFLALALRALVRARREGELSSARLRDGRLWGFGASAALAVLGFVLGALIRGSTTTVPAHYHASIGAVTAAFMTLAYPLLEALGNRAPTGRMAALARVQPLLYGAGQMVFATGFALAGAHGMARKVYGAEQQGRDLQQTLGLVVMGLGGVVAIAGGLAFLFLVLRTWRAPRRPIAARELAEASTH
jgi:hypothetical protein